MANLFNKLDNSAILMFRFVSIYEKYLSNPSSIYEGLTAVERIVLISIDNNHGITNNALAEYLGRTPGAVTQIVLKLEEKGFVERVKHKNNGKTVHLFPTAKGVTKSIEFRAKEASIIDKIMETLGNIYKKEELDSFWNVLKDYLKIIPVMENK